MDAPNPTTAAPRDVAFDVAKGVGIVAVVALHLSNRAARLFHHPLDGGWWTLKSINQLANFCVPLFLFISAILMARSASRRERPDWKGFAGRRARSVALPLLLWSLFYWILRGVVLHDASLMRETTRTLPFFGVVQGPALLLDWPRRLVELIWGKAEFHLYFLSILLQICILLPFAFLALRRVRLNIWTATLLGIGFQAGVVLLQKVVRFPYPGSCALWYAYGLIPAIWLGMNWKGWAGIRRAAWPMWAFISVVGFAIFAYQVDLGLIAAANHEPSPVNGTLQNSAVQGYALGTSMLILVALTLWGSFAARIQEHLRVLGVYSLQIYLMHPVVMDLLSRHRSLVILDRLPLPSLWMFLGTLYGTFGLGVLLSRAPYVDQILFGRPPPVTSA